MMISILIKALGTIVTRLLASMATEKMLEYVLFKVAHILVKKTNTIHDDEFLNKLEAMYKKSVTNKKSAK